MVALHCRGMPVSRPSNHYSMLLTIEEGLGLTRLGYTSDTSQVHSRWPLITSHR